MITDPTFWSGALFASLFILTVTVALASWWSLRTPQLTRDERRMVDEERIRELADDEPDTWQPGRWPTRPGRIA